MAVAPASGPVTVQLQEGLGAVADGEAHEVTPESVGGYAEAVNLSPRRWDPGDAVPPVYAAAAPSIVAIGGLLGHVLPDDILAVAVHLGQTMVFAEPIRVGEGLRSRATLVEVGTGGYGSTLTLRIDVSRGGPNLAAQAFHRVLLRGVRLATPGGALDAPPEAPARSRARSAVGQRVFAIADDQSIRYSEASGDRMAIHTDVAVARQSGFPGLILHGMCTFALCAQLVVDLVGGGDPGRLTTLSATFIRPVLCGTSLTVAVERGDRGEVRVTASQAGRAVTRNGWAIVTGSP